MNSISLIGRATVHRLGKLCAGKALLPTAATLLVAGALAFAPAAAASTERGGVDLGMYCAHTYGPTGVFSLGDEVKYTYATPENISGKWDGWRCDTGRTGFSQWDLKEVDMNAACAQQHGKDALFTKTSNGAWAWGSGPGGRAWADRIGDGAADWRCYN